MISFRSSLFKSHTCWALISTLLPAGILFIPPGSCLAVADSMSTQKVQHKQHIRRAAAADLVLCASEQEALKQKAPVTNRFGRGGEANTKRKKNRPEVIKMFRQHG